jgi:hypothetical protein
LGPLNIALIDDAARDLEDFSEKIMAPGHWPSWSYPQVPDGLALCLVMRGRSFILRVAAVVVFVLAVAGVAPVPMTPLGLALWCGSTLVP